MTLPSLFVLCPQLGQDLLVAGLAAGNAVKVAAGGFANRHAFSSKGSADVAEIACAAKQQHISRKSVFPYSVPPNYVRLSLGVISSPNVFNETSFMDSLKSFEI